MKLKIFFSRETYPKMQLSADMKKTDPKGIPWTCNSLYLDFTNTPHAKEFDLKKWKIVRGREKWNGLADETSPELRDGDEVRFYATPRKTET